ncbi:hypothetical protein Tco_0974103 [Tanacetum coccineum]|uniref:Nucleolus and neural progenitor protein-like N-terminal domain-containing protein n=1 Tax=Tanacetum coccineum TaxID=301880 RepID=A0ABQ5EAS5_9ASTR
MALVHLSTVEEDMDAEFETIDARLQSFISQFHSEVGVLDRIIHKYKNQHRRSSYFQYLLKVRRDCKLLQTTNLVELVNSSFLVINGNRPKQKLQLLESFERDAKGFEYSRNGLWNGPAFMVVCWASVGAFMVEPMLKGAIYYLMLCQHSTWFPLYLVFREYYPTNEQSIYLECVWETDKFILLERKSEPDNKSPDTIKEDVVCRGSSKVEYQSVETILGENKSLDTVMEKTSEEDVTTIKTDNLSSIDCLTNDCKQAEEPNNAKDHSGLLESSRNNLEHEHRHMDSGLAVSSSPPKPEPRLKKKVAFISVKRPEPSKANDTEVIIKPSDGVNGEKEDPFFSLLTGGSHKQSLL